MALALDQFISRLAESGLLTEADVRAFVKSLPAGEQPSVSQQLARMLVKAKRLTAYQAQEVYKGNGKSLVLGNYVILDKLGQGGMGMVLKAEHRRMKRIVALKVLSPAAVKSPEAVQRFHREVEAAAKLEHPNIVAAHDADEAGGTHFLVMQYIEGTDLSALVKKAGPLPVDKAVNCILQAARGLEYAHGEGVIHRDIKPANLLLDHKGTVKILDMGLARFEASASSREQSDLTGTGQIMGTVDYMAPEQAMNTKHADQRADIYSLGISLWYLVTGQAAYDGETLMEKLIAHREQPIPSLQEACPQASRSLNVVFTKMVAKTPEARYQSMTEVIAELQRCTGGESSAVSPVSTPGGDSRVNEFLHGGEPSRSPAVAMKAVPKTMAVSPAEEATIVGQGAQVDTDPQTEQSLQKLSSASQASVAVPRKQPASPPWWRQKPAWIAASAGGGLLLLLAAIVFFVQTKDGVIRVEIDDPQIEVAIKGTNIVLKQADQGKDVELSPGEKTLIVKRGDFTFETNKLVLKKGKNTTVHVELLAGQVEVKQGEKILGQKTLPPVWHGWPADAPPPAIAPFNVEQAKKHQAAWAKYLKVPVEYKNSLGMKFVLIPPGEFTMGSTPAEIEKALKFVVDDKHWQDCIKSEAPQHKVILTQPIYLGGYEVTQAEYEKVMEKNPSSFAKTGPEKQWVDKVAGMDTSGHPVEGVSWNDAAEFCAKLSEQEKLKPYYFRSGETVTILEEGTGYRLPTEAEWEFACRAGTTTKYWIGDKDEDLPPAGWFNVNSAGRTHKVGELAANPFDLYDIHGNVWEWVQDWWDPTYYEQFREKPALNPDGPSSGSQRVFRGGYWYYVASGCRTSFRLASDPARGAHGFGFRVSLTMDAVKAAIAKEKTPAKEATGWYGWPADAPSPAVAPFNAEQAKAHQVAWAKYLKVPVEYTNTIGMKFRLIPPGEFEMGLTPEEIEEALKFTDGEVKWQDCIKSQGPKHKVILTKPIYLGIYEVTQAEYEKVMSINPSRFSPTGEGRDAVTELDTSRYPVEMVSWNDAAEFSAKLSEREQLKPYYSRSGETVSMLEGTGYRLPTEAEWEFTCRAGTTAKFWIGGKVEDLTQVAWLATNSGNRTHQVGGLKVNPLGLYDLHGNVYEWVQDWWEASGYAQFQGKPAIDPNGPSLAASRRLARGYSWFNVTSHTRSSDRDTALPTFRHGSMGFRVALPVDAVKAALADAPPAAIAPFNAEQAKQHQEAWAKYLKVPVEYKNSIGMKFVLIPPGEFMMGSTAAEIDEALKFTGEDKHWQECIRSEGPKHKVILTQPIYLGVHEVTQAEYEKIIGKNPSHFAAMGAGKDAVAGIDTSHHPVEMVSWNDAAEFCAKLSEQEKLKPFYTRSGETVTMSKEGTGYRLPTEAEWEFACRAGTTTKYWSGDKDEDLPQAGWISGNSASRTHNVGELKANPFGLHDIHGNVWEWVQDWWETTYYVQFQASPAVNPNGPPSAGSDRVIRGGSWHGSAISCWSSDRFVNSPVSRYYSGGFRVSLVVGVVRDGRP